jgi:hypothetical protein
MSIKESILNSIIHDLTTCQHLASKIDASKADWRPAPNMRSTLELMQYLSFIGYATVKHILNPIADRAASMGPIGEASARAGQNVNFNNFSEAIESEKQQIADLLKNITDEDLQNKQTYFPWNPASDVSLYIALTTATVKFVCAYRHQLFLYAKMLGANVNTLNNWAGMDSPAPAPKIEAEEGAMA